MQTPHEPTAQEVLAALEHIVSSPMFVRAHRLQDLLRFVTRETLAGRKDTLNGYNIAIAVFGMGPDFDASSDPRVRVEARRLRSKLCEYYSTLGADAPVRIELRPGSYAPRFLAAARAPVPPALPAPAEQRRGWARPAWAFGLTAAAIAAAWGVGGMPPLTAIPDDEVERAPQKALRIHVQEFRSLDSADMPHIALGITEEIMIRLGGYPDLQLFVAPGGSTVADFVLSGSIDLAGDAIRVVPQLVDARSGKQVWSAQYTEPLATDSVWKVVESVSGAVAAAVGEPYGPMFDAEVERTAATSASDPYHCLLRFLFALQVISEPAHGRATACFEAAVAADPHASMAWARLAALYRMEYLHAFNAKAGAPPPLERAETAVRRALELDPRNPFANQEMAFLQLLLGDRTAFESFVARTLDLNPSADIRAALGINFIKMGEVERGLALVDRSIADSPRAPPFFFMGYVVQALRENDYAAAYKAAQRMVTRDWPFSQAVLAATAALAGDPQRARTAAARLLELRPTFAADGRDLIARGRLGADFESKIGRGLALAGVSLN